MTDDGFVHLKNLRTLELLDVSPYSQPYMGKSPRRSASDDVLAKQKLSSGALVYLHGLPSLRQLKCLIPFNKKLADSLRAIPKLKVDSLILCDSNDDVLNELKRFPEVRSVMILDGSFGNTGLAALSELVQLERLFVV